jgi:hypothetical protein
MQKSTNMGCPIQSMVLLYVSKVLSTCSTTTGSEGATGSTTTNTATIPTAGTISATGTSTTPDPKGCARRQMVPELLPNKKEGTDRMEQVLVGGLQ